MGFESMRVLDLSQDFSMHTPAFASYDGPSIKWVKRLAFDKVGGQEITSTLHVGTHLDGPWHLAVGGQDHRRAAAAVWLVGSAVGGRPGADGGGRLPAVRARAFRAVGERHRAAGWSATTSSSSTPATTASTTRTGSTVA